MMSGRHNEKFFFPPHAFPIRKILVLSFCFLRLFSFAQTLGGNATYNFLTLPSSPLLTAMGGANVSYNANDVSLAAANPALLQPAITTQLNASFNSFLAGIKNYSLSGAYHSERLNTTFGGHVYYVDYGAIPAADAAGNISGSFRPVDFVVQFSAAKKYLERWTYGVTLKFIQSSYAPYSSSAIAVDVGLLYTDSANQFTASVVAKNMGTQLKTYAGATEELPFDLQAGISKRLTKAPLAFSLTVHHLHRFAVTYNDVAFNNENDFSPPSSFDKVFNHFVLATHVYLGQNLEAIVGYNHLRRQELSTPGAANGLTGFSAGLHIKFSKLQIQLARASYQRGISFNQLGLTVALNKLSGLGK
jgi:hypothetical protein